MRVLLQLAQTQDASNDSAIFVGVIVGVVLFAIGLVLWSRKRGKVEARLPESDDIKTSGPEARPRKPEAKPARAATRAAPAPAPAPEPDVLAFGRTIEEGLAKTRSQGFMSRLAGIFKKEIDDNLEEKIEEILLTSDIGVQTAQKLLARVKDDLSRAHLKDKNVVYRALREEIRRMLSSFEAAEIDAAPGKVPRVILVVGVNGTGKTTTIGKLAFRLVSEGNKVLLVAADTFRAAAVEQLEIWSNRAGTSFSSGKEGQDPASVAFEGVRKGQAEGVDIVVVDTAGRLHTKKNLVEEMKKISRACGKAHEGAPHETLLVLDSTTGQNAIQQAKIFGEEAEVTGIVLSKLDGTAKGGVVIGICDMLRIPVRYVGVGEQKEDLQPFSADAFLNGLFGDAGK